MAFLSANIAVCETVIWEQNINVPTLVRVMSVLSVPPGSDIARFLVVSAISAHPGDLESHFVFIHITDKQGALVASTEPSSFTYGYQLDPNGAGGFTMTTTVILDLAKLPGALPCNLLIQVFLDNVRDAVGKTPLLIRRT